MDINTLLNTGELANTTGTSQATALISGYIALLKEQALDNGYDLDQKTIKDILHKIKENKLSYSEGMNMIIDTVN